MSLRWLQIFFPLKSPEEWSDHETGLSRKTLVSVFFPWLNSYHAVLPCIKHCNTEKPKHRLPIYIYIYIYIYIIFLSIAVWIDEQKFEWHKRVTIYGRVLDYYSHLLIFVAPIPSNIMFAAFWLFSYSRIESQCLHGIIHLLLGISFQS